MFLPSRLLAASAVALSLALSWGCSNEAPVGNGPDAGSSPVNPGSQCLAPKTECNGVCTDVTADKNHCGTCQTKCTGNGGFPATCYQSSCVSSCPAGTTPCNGTCVDLLNDPNSCGSCGNSCGANGSCINGTCSCGLGADKCNTNSCFDLMTSTRHCGNCATSCNNGATCQQGQCGCPAGSASCNGSCAFISADPNRCGPGCGATQQCADAQACVSGSCVCRSGLTACATGCVDTLSDPNNCGGCAGGAGQVCGVGQMCVNGSCTTGGSNLCTAPLSACGRSCVNLNTSPLHCGDCANQCGRDEVCVKPSNAGKAACRQFNAVADCAQCATDQACCPAATPGMLMCVEGATCPQ